VTGTGVAAVAAALAAAVGVVAMIRRRWAATRRDPHRAAVVAVKKLLYKPLSLTFGVLGGIIAEVVFKQVWKLATGDDDAPDADMGWGEALTAAAVQGASWPG